MARAQHAVLSKVVVIIQKQHNEGLHFQGRTMQSPTKRPLLTLFWPYGVPRRRHVGGRVNRFGWSS